jgi:hypothetical protein
MVVLKDGGIVIGCTNVPRDTFFISSRSRKKHLLGREYLDSRLEIGVWSLFEDFEFCFCQNSPIAIHS